MPGQKLARVMVVEDDRHFVHVLRAAITPIADEVHFFGSCEEFEAHHQRHGCPGCSAVWIDIALPGAPGWRCLQCCLACSGGFPKRVVLCSGVTDPGGVEYRALLSSLRKVSCVNTLTKPVSVQKIRDVLQ